MGRLLIILLLLFVAKVNAEDIYVTDQTSGGDTGSDAANAHSVGWLNTSGNWGSGANKISAGDTVHLCGTITNVLVIAGDGANNSPVTILFEAGCRMTAATWPSTGGIVLGTHNWLILDGQNQGVIENTNNGTMLGNQLQSVGIAATSISNIIIRGLYITNLYQRTPGSITDNNRYGEAIDVAGSNLTISNNVCSGGDTLIAIGVPGASTNSNVVVVSNTVTDCNHGIILGNSQANAWMADVYFLGNRIFGLNTWAYSAALHLDPFYFFVEGGPSVVVSNLVIAGNHIGPRLSTNTVAASTAAIFMSSYYSNNLIEVKIYNNLIEMSPGDLLGNGAIVCGGYGNSFVANNTVISYSQNGIGITIGFASSVDSTNGRGVVRFIHNNLLYEIGRAIDGGSLNEWPDYFRSDFNVYYNVDHTASGAFVVPGNHQWAFSDWTNNPAYGGYLGRDVNSTTNQPVLDAHFIPTAVDQVMRGQGTNLSAYFTTDFNGAVRPSSGPWTIGAFNAEPLPPNIARQSGIKGLRGF